MSTRELELRQLDDLLCPLRERPIARPRKGWLRSIRSALSMTSAQLAKRLHTSQSAVIEFEQREAADTITLGALRRVATAMNCDLVYAIVPRQPLSEMLERQAQAVARRKLGPIAHSMGLEDQRVSDSAMEAQVRELVRELLERRRRELWQ